MDLPNFTLDPRKFYGKSGATPRFPPEESEDECLEDSDDEEYVPDEPIQSGKAIK